MATAPHRGAGLRWPKPAAEAGGMAWDASAGGLAPVAGGQPGAAAVLQLPRPPSPPSGPIGADALPAIRGTIHNMLLSLCAMHHYILWFAVDSPRPPR